MLHDMVKNIDFVMFGGFEQPTFSETVISPDGTIRIVNFAEQTGGNGSGSVVNKTVLAYENAGGTSLLFDFMYLYANNILKDAPSRQMNFGIFEDFKIHCVYINNITYYLIESHPVDDAPCLIEYGEDGECVTSKMANHWCVAAAYRISKGKFVPAPIIDGKSTLCVVADSVTRPMFLTVIPDENVLCVPHVDKADYIFNGKYDRIRLTSPD